VLHVFQIFQQISEYTTVYYNCLNKLDSEYTTVYYNFLLILGWGAEVYFCADICLTSL
jgi:hypothetical protein